MIEDLEWRFTETAHERKLELWAYDGHTWFIVPTKTIEER